MLRGSDGVDDEMTSWRGKLAFNPKSARSSSNVVHYYSYPRKNTKCDRRLSGQNCDLEMDQIGLDWDPDPLRTGGISQLPAMMKGDGSIGAWHRQDST